jgi:hypothetical protein
VHHPHNYLEIPNFELTCSQEEMTMLGTTH